DIQIPDSLQVEGKNIMPLLKGETTRSPHAYLYWAGPGTKHYSEENQEFWHGYHQWITYQRQTPPVNPNLEKLSKGAWAVRDGEWALYFYDDGKNQPQLFNDNTDPSESIDLAKQNPQKVAELKNAYYQWIKDKPKPVIWGQDHYQILVDSAKP
ncbi:arylsulfatase, partial [Staphylococcus epidermidis]|nr:arylsulfatase [Staphylococcus epidermidis]